MLWGKWKYNIGAQSTGQESSYRFYTLNFHDSYKSILEIKNVSKYTEIGGIEGLSLRFMIQCSD